MLTKHDYLGQRDKPWNASHVNFGSVSLPDRTNRADIRTTLQPLSKNEFVESRLTVPCINSRCLSFPSMLLIRFVRNICCNALVEIPKTAAKFVCAYLVTPINIHCYESPAERFHSWPYHTCLLRDTSRINTLRRNSSRDCGRSPPCVRLPPPTPTGPANACSRLSSRQIRLRADASESH